MALRITNRYLFCFVWQSSTGVNKCNANINCEWKEKFKNSKKFKFKLDFYFTKIQVEHWIEKVF